MYRSSAPAALVLTGLACAMLLAGCHRHPAIHVRTGSMDFEDTTLVLHARGAPDARLSGEGTFSIGDQAVTVTAEQRAQLVVFYGAARSIVEHGIATGKAGAAVGLGAASDVLDGLAKGDTSQIGAKVEARADQVLVAAGKICGDLSNVRQLQAKVAASLEAFRPYGSVSEADIAECVEGTSKRSAG